MPFQRASLRQIEERVEADIASNLGLSVLPRRSVTRSHARAQAGAAHGLYGYLAWIAKQAVPITAEAELLESWASVWGMTRKPAAQALGEVEFTGTGAVTIPLGTVLQRSDGVRYTTDADAPLVSGSALATVTAALGGADGNAIAGTKLGLVSPIGGIISEVTVQADAVGLGLSGGTDPETDAQLLARLMQQVQTPPAGGADADWVAWALEVPGVTRAWCKPLWMGAGTVGLTFVLDGDPALVPGSPKVAEMQAHLEDPTRRPVTAVPVAFAPTLKDLDPVIVLNPNTPAVQAAVTAAIEELLLREAAPGATLLISHLREAISTAAGELDHSLTSPTLNVSTLPNELLVLGTPAFS